MTNNYSFKVEASLQLVAKSAEGRSQIKETEISIFSDDPNVNHQFQDPKIGYTELGVKAMTQGFIQGLVTNIHAAHQNGTWDSAKHLRYIINELERGFAMSGAQVDGYTKKRSKKRRYK